MVELDDKEVAELETLQDEIYSRLARRYGLAKGEIAKLAVKRYGGDEMTEKTEEILSNVRGVIGGGGDVMDRMMMWEMIKDMRNQRANQPQPAPIQQPQPQQMRQPAQEKMTMQDMMMMMMMPMVAKGMTGGEDEILKIYKYKMMMGGEDGSMNLEKLEQMLREERAETDARMEQLMNTMFGQQEAIKIREAKEKHDRELEQRIANAEYLARHPTTPQEPLQTARDKLDESLGMMTDMKAKMEQAGMVQRPESPEDKTFTKDMEELKHKQSIEAKAVDKLANAAEKLNDTADRTLNKVIDLTAEEQRVRQRQLDMMSPEERAKLQAQYEVLGEQALREQEEPTTPKGSLDITEEDDLDATE